MKWLIGNTHTSVRDATEAELAWLKDYLSYTAAVYVPSRKRKETQRSTVYNAIAHEFPSGLARYVYLQARKEGVSIQTVDVRTPPCVPDPDVDLSWLRHHPAVDGEITHQIEAVEAVVQRKRGILWMPTGSGKTHVAVGVSVALPCRWLFLVHRIDLLRQTANRYQKITGEWAGILGDGRKDLPDEYRFMVASFQTVTRGLAKAKPGIVDLVERWAEGLLVDEVHTLGAPSHLEPVMRAASAYYRIGLSGTPLARGDGRNLLVIGALGPVILRVEAPELVQAGLLSKPQIRMVGYKHPACTKTTWNGVYRERIVRSEDRNALVADIVTRRAARPIMVFVKHIPHGKILKGLFEAAGLNVDFVWGNAETLIRETQLAALERGLLDVLVCNVIFQEGIDVPSLRSVVIAAGGASQIAVVQRMGRGMRVDPSTGKSAFEVWDIWDKGCGCEEQGPPTDWSVDLDEELPGTTHKACRWLQRQARARKRSYQREGFEVMVEDQQLTLF